MLVWRHESLKRMENSVVPSPSHSNCTLPIAFTPVDRWRGDWVLPVFIGAGPASATPGDRTSSAPLLFAKLKTQSCRPSAGLDFCGPVQPRRLASHPAIKMGSMGIAALAQDLPEVDSSVGVIGT